jgi:hypothetical protein
MIQDKLPQISLKALELPAYLVFALLVLDRALAWTLKWTDKKRGCNGKDAKNPVCMASVPWALHDKTTQELKACAEKTVELQGKTMTALHRLADAGEAQATAIRDLGGKFIQGMPPRE